MIRLRLILLLGIGLAAGAVGTAGPKPKKAKSHRRVPRSARVSHTHRPARPRVRTAYRAPLLPSRELSDGLVIPTETVMEREEPEDPIVMPPPAPPPAPGKPWAPPPIAAQRGSTTAEPWRLGGSLALLGRGGTSNGDALGLRLHYGVRGTALIPAWNDRIVLRPGISYYLRSSGSGYAGVLENLAEVNLGAQYRVWRLSRWQFLAGIAQSVTVSFSRIAAADVASWTAPQFGYRIGPSGSALFQLTPELALLGDIDVTFGIDAPVRPHFGLATGVVLTMP